MFPQLYQGAKFLSASSLWVPTQHLLLSRLAVVCPFTSLDQCRHVLLYQTPQHVLYQLLNVLPVLETSWLLISKVYGWQGTVRALKEETRLGVSGSSLSGWSLAVRMLWPALMLDDHKLCANAQGIVLLTFLLRPRLLDIFRSPILLEQIRDGHYIVGAYFGQILDSGFLICSWRPTFFLFSMRWLLKRKHLETISEDNFSRDKQTSTLIYWHLSERSF